MARTHKPRSPVNLVARGVKVSGPPAKPGLFERFRRFMHIGKHPQRHSVIDTLLQNNAPQYGKLIYNPEEAKNIILSLEKGKYTNQVQYLQSLLGHPTRPPGLLIEILNKKSSQELDTAFGNSRGSVLIDYYKKSGKVGTAVFIDSGAEGFNEENVYDYLRRKGNFNAIDRENHHYYEGIEENQPVRVYPVYHMKEFIKNYMLIKGFVPEKQP